MFTSNLKELIKLAIGVLTIGVIVWFMFFAGGSLY